MHFKHNFRNFTKFDYYGYGGAMRLPNGGDPKICLFELSEDDSLDIIVSGDGAGSTLISLYSEYGNYILSIPGCNSCHAAIADSIVDNLKDYENLEEAVHSVVSDFEMTEI